MLTCWVTGAGAHQGIKDMSIRNPLRDPVVQSNGGRPCLIAHVGIPMYVIVVVLVLLCENVKGYDVKEKCLNSPPSV